MVTSRQTVSYLKQRFREVGLQPATRHGQNFLIDMNLQQLLVDSAQLEPRDVVLEVGTGTGALTALMSPRVAAVVTIEIDERLQVVAAEELIDCENVTMLRGDALRNKNHFTREVIETIEGQLAAGEDRQFKLVANLPYNIATPVISNLLSAPVVPTTMTVTIQKELGERITAAPSTKDYGALSIWMQSQCEIEVVRIMGPSVFWPKPKVESAILHIRVDPQRRGQIPDLDFFHEFVRAMFFHRRKFLRGVLASAMKGRLDKAEVDEVMGEMDFGPDARAEQLDVETMLRLCETVRRRLS
ncbi:MAG: ribosomal RNA small subunit methyltransferase A [Planctomycetota bacterium]|nr:MAG: ribosomal RNA small subunit methyltransferase A [Planctomycetota bacterium]REK44430.1 MAG: ribosomal RNA small subunit methyltransferase A [Planctomycetota bacterium]